MRKSHFRAGWLQAVMVVAVFGCRTQQPPDDVTWEPLPEPSRPPSVTPAETPEQAAARQKWIEQEQVRQRAWVDDTVVRNGGTPRNEQPSEQSASIRRGDEHPLDAFARESIACGAVHSVDVNASRVRMSPLFWVNLSIEQKQQSVMLWSQYFKSLGRPGQVEILSDRNDTVLASYSVWSGVKIVY